MIIKTGRKNPLFCEENYIFKREQYDENLKVYFIFSFF